MLEIARRPLSVAVQSVLWVNVRRDADTVRGFCGHASVALHSSHLSCPPVPHAARSGGRGF